MSDAYEMKSVAFVEGCIGRAQDDLNQALHCSGLLGLEDDQWARLYLLIGKAQQALERAKKRVVETRSRRLADMPRKDGAT